MSATEPRSPLAAILLATALLATAVVSGACDGLRSPFGTAGASVRGVVLVLVDALRADHLDVYGYARSTAPSLDRWARRGVVFDQARSAAPWTLPSVSSILTGVYPSQHGAGRILAEGGERPVELGYTAESIARLLEAGGVSMTRLDSSFSTLGEILGERGFVTGAVVNNPFLEPALGLGQGFSEIDARPTTNARIRRADATVDDALGWLDRHASGPFFLLVHLMDPHLDYDPPASVRGEFTAGYRGPLSLPVGDDEGWRDWRTPREAAGLSDEDRGFVVAAYDEEILFVDRQLDRLLSGLRDLGLLGESMVILTADHGEEFWDHGRFEHGHSLYDEILRVPLIVWAPGVEAGRRDEPVSLVDLFPTVLEATGAGPPPADQDGGVSLWPTLRGRAPAGDELERPLFASGILYGPDRQAAIRWPMKGIRTRGEERWQVFDLVDDPGEAVDLGAGRAATIARLRRDLDDLRQAAVADRVDEALKIDVETLRSLQALGYVGGGETESEPGPPDGDGR